MFCFISTNDKMSPVLKVRDPWMYETSSFADANEKPLNKKQFPDISPGEQLMLPLREKKP